MTRMVRPLANLRDYAQALAYVVASITAAYLASPYCQLSDLAMIHMLGIILMATRCSVRASISACVASILAFDYFFIPPKFAFAWTDAKSSLLFVAMLAVATVISTLHQRLRQQEQVARAAAFRAESLFALNAELSGVHDAEQLVALTARHLERLFSASVVIALRGVEGALNGIEDAEEAAFAARALARRELTCRQGAASASVWVPLASVHSVFGVIGLRLSGGFERDSAQGFLLSAFANQLATSLERVQLANAVQRTQLEAESERLRSSLLSAVSHDLKTPLATIIAAGTTLIGRKAELDEQASEELLTSIVGEGERLSRLIQNLLSIARLESPTIELRRTPEAIEEIVGAAVERFGRLGKPRVRVELEADLPLVSVEPLLLEQVVMNLLENAARHGGPDVTIAVHASTIAGFLSVQIADDGPGIPDDERDKVFEKFYRGRRTAKNDGGAGLGLTICRAIIRAHGGRIVARERPGGGALIEFSLPLAAAAAAEEPRAESAVAS